MTDAEAFAALDATWPAAEVAEHSGWLVRNGAGGGKRVSAASQISLDADINVAADAMRAMGQVPLFQVRGDETALDDALEAAGYSIIDPVWIYSAPTADLIDGLSEQSRVYRGQFAVAAMQEIWAAGGIEPGPDKGDGTGRFAKILAIDPYR